MSTSATSPHPPDLPVVNVHTPISSYGVIHSLQQDTFASLAAKLAKKEGARVAEGWIKYEWNESIWNLDDESDYSIFVWRFTSSPTHSLHIRDPSSSLPSPSSMSYINQSYYLLRPPPPTPPKSRLLKPKSKTASKTGTRRSMRTSKSLPGTKSKHAFDDEEGDSVPIHKKEFEKHHSEQGVRTVFGQIGPVKGVRMLLKEGYRHVYISRTFAAKHGFIPKDATPGNYGYGGIVHIGVFPITIAQTTTTHPLYLTEETHFDVVLGRSFMEKRGVQMDGTDMTNVICRDTGEKLEIEVVVLRDGRGAVVTVT